MKLIIPMAGKGTRLRPHSHTTPKPLLPVAGTMIIERIIQTFSRTLDRKIDEIAFVLGDFGDEVKQTLTDMSRRHDAKATFYKQDEALGTAHAVYCAADSLEGEVIIVFADTLFDTSQKVSVEGADSVIWLKHVDDPSRFGVAVEEEGRITGFVEKPSELISNLAIIGVYYFREGGELKKQIEYLLQNRVVGHGDEYQLTDAIDRMLKDGKVFKPATVDEWLDCGTIPAWLDTSREIIKKENSRPAGEYKNSKIVPPVYLADGVSIEDSEIGPNVSLGAGSVISGSTIRDAIVLDEARVINSRISNSTVGVRATVDHTRGEVHIGDDSTVSTNADKS
ncbi:MAG: sugar phosphate nucleotidyltransferase [Balneolales bacterium]